MRQVREGMTFGRLVVTRTGYQASTAWCQCQCGRMRRVPKGDLRAGLIDGCRVCDPREDSVLPVNRLRD